MDESRTFERRRLFAITFVLWWVACCAWAFATPIWTAPDEHQHAFRAYGVVRGEVYVHPESAQLGTGGFVHVPAGWKEAAKTFNCYSQQPGVSADCIAPITDDRTEVRTPSTAARYNPLYYAVVGLGTLGTSPETGIYVMRIISGALTAWFLAWACTSAARSARPRFAVSIVVFAATPMVSFLGGSVNPNGLEIAAAISAWVNGILLLTTKTTGDRALFLRRAAISMMAFTLTRGLSPLWLAVLVTTLVIAFARREHFAWLRTKAWKWPAAVCAAAVAGGVWTIAAKTLTLNVNKERGDAGYWEGMGVLWAGGDRIQFYLQGTIGIFGWLDAWMPRVSQMPWMTCALVIVFTTLRYGSSRLRYAFALLLTCVVALPFLIEAANYNTSGLVWQPRYTMPISLGLMLLCGIALSSSQTWQPSMRIQRRTSIVLCITALWTNVAGLLYALGRTMTGNESFAFSGNWAPPLPVAVLAVVQLGVFAALALLTSRLSSASESGQHVHAPDALDESTNQ
jgi:hypothetical protein